MDAPWTARDSTSIRSGKALWQATLCQGTDGRALIHLKGANGIEVDGWMAIGEVVGVHIDLAYLKQGLFDIVAAQPIARCGYRGDYAQVNEIFEMSSPT